MDVLPLSGVRVLELATILAGPAVGAFFAELGADVIKAENPTSGGDPTRGWLAADEQSEDGRCAYFCSVNWGKRSLELDPVTQPERFHALLASCDILLMNSKPGDCAKLGLVPEKLLERYPRLLIGWVTGYGQDSKRPGFDALIQAESGFMLINGPPGGPACKMPVALIDLLTAHQLKQGLLLALLARERSGAGRLVEVSLWETALSSLTNQATNYLMTGVEPVPSGTEHPNLFPYGTMLPCVDTPLLLAVGTDRQWRSLCGVLQAAELAALYPKNADRVRNREQLREALFAHARQRQAAELLQALWDAGVPAGGLHSVGHALSSPQAQHLRLSAGALSALRTRTFGGFPRATSLRPPPRLGEHTEEVLAELLERGQPGQVTAQD
jgi:crotonobetainyl-CoA:carnitine CoA-transferase CaiB-like acyl-CoA transferase